MGEYRHLQTINKGIEGPPVTENVTNTYEGASPLIGAIYISNNMGTASAVPKLLGTININQDDFMADYGSIMRIHATFKRGVTVEGQTADRYILITLGTTTYATSLLLASDVYGADETSDETYLVDVDLVRTGLNTVTYVSSVKCITVFPLEEQVTLSEDVGYTMPAAPAVCFWGTNADSGSVTLVRAYVEYLPLQT